MLQVVVARVVALTALTVLTINTVVKDISLACFTKKIEVI
jgi:hypothetical protein